MKIFDEDPRVAVITTKHVVHGEPILSVFHHEEDGMWEFIGETESTEEDYMVLALENIIKLDSSILQIADLPLGSKAYREDKNSSWKIENNE